MKTFGFRGLHRITILLSKWVYGARVQRDAEIEVQITYHDDEGSTDEIRPVRDEKPC
jgi:hypothetical protein